MLDKVPDGQQSPRTSHIKAKKGTTCYSEDDVLSTSQVLALIQGALSNGSLKLALWVSMSYELALRTHESRILQLRHLQKDKEGLGYHVGIPEATKTDGRVVPLDVSVGLLERYLNEEHGFTSDKNSPLFYTIRNGKPEFMEHATLAKQLRVLSKRVLGYSISSYLLRHSRLHQLKIVERLPEETVQLFCGHSIGSRQLSIIYSHPSKSQVDLSLRQCSGIKVEPEGKDKNTFKVKSCQNPKCAKNGRILEPFAVVCPSCKEILRFRVL